MLENNYYFFKKAISIEACEKILKAGRTRMSKKAKVSNHKISNVRKCKVGWVQEPWIYDIINPFIHTAKKKQVGIFNGIGMKPLNLLFIIKVIIMDGTQINILILLKILIKNLKVR